MPEISSDSSRMLVEKRLVQHDLDEVAAARRRADHADRVGVVAEERVERVGDGAVPRHVAHVDLVMHHLRHVGGRKQAALRARLHRHRAGADAAENLPRQSVRHHAARRCIEHQRRGVGGGEAVVEPVQAEVRDRRHVDQHFGDHHEQDRQDQELAGQAKPHRSRRLAARIGGRGCCLDLSHRRPDRHPRRRSTFRRRPTHDDVNLGVKKDTAARLPISL